MKKIIFLYFLISSFAAFGQTKLERQVELRDQLLLQWEDSESKKTGFFGNRTKRDMAETNEWLRRIVEQDNLIMEELRFSFSIDSSLISQEKEDYKAITLRLEQNIQALERALADRDRKLGAKDRERRTFEWISLFLFLGCLGLGYQSYKSNKTRNMH
jgi:hypothetical protein